MVSANQSLSNRPLVNSVVGIYNFSVQDDSSMVSCYLFVLFKLVLTSEKLLRGPLINIIFHRKVES